MCGPSYKFTKNWRNVLESLKNFDSITAFWKILANDLAVPIPITAPCSIA